MARGVGGAESQRKGERERGKEREQVGGKEGNTGACPLVRDPTHALAARETPDDVAVLITVYRRQAEQQRQPPVFSSAENLVIPENQLLQSD